MALSDLLEHSAIAEPHAVAHLEQSLIIPQPVVMIIWAEPVDQPHDGPHDGHHGGDAQPHVRREGINEEGVLGEVAGPPVHEGVGLHVDGLGEVDNGHPCVVHGE